MYRLSKLNAWCLAGCNQWPAEAGSIGSNGDMILDKCVFKNNEAVSSAATVSDI
jgi:hypothetical protein